jgi:SAM-dependent methyltransferase
LSDNAAQIEFWNGEAGDTWVRAQERLDEVLETLSSAALHHAAPGVGERVLDVGCGCGATSLAMAGRGADVWGVDVSAPMLERARARATGVHNVRFSQNDAATATYTPDHDLVFSRFGVMFFADPVAAFANLRCALKPDGRLVFLCWQAAQANPWVAVAGRAVQPFLPPPEAPPDPRAPGPFAFADADFVCEVLGDAGYRNVACDALEGALRLGGSLDEALDFQSEVGPLSRALADLDEATREQAVAAAREALAPHLTDAGLELGAACWLVRATP